MTQQILIGLSGSARSGKTTAAMYLEAEYGFRTFSFAAPIKSGIASTFGFGLDDLEGERKEQIIPWLGHSPRYLMQTLGTEWGRGLVMDDIWLRLTSRAITQARECCDAEVFLACVTDCRFENEAAWVRANDGLMIHIDRAHDTDVRWHISERGLDRMPKDLVIQNNGTVNDFFSKIDQLVIDHMAQRVKIWAPY